MADIRINSLSTTASSTASDDFIAVDGTTNGTRKLNAYSPSFGGNATVGGTLTATTGITVGEDAQITNSATVASGTRLTINTKAQQGIDIYRSDANANFSGIRFRNSANSATNAQIGWNGTTLRVDATTVEVPGTTASTSTSTGALVVSGGVGVAKEAYVGKTCVVGAGSDNASYVNVYTNDAENTAGPFDITLPSDCVGVVFLNSYQSGVGRSFWEIPFVSFGGTVTLGTARKTIVTADPVTSAVAAASSKITVSLVAANTNCYWGIYVNKSY